MKSLILTALTLLVATCSYVDSYNVAEVYFVVEPRVIQNYMKLGYSQSDAISTIKGDINYVLYQVNELYKSTQRYGLQMEIRQKALKIMDPTDEMFEECKLIRNNGLQADLGIEVFREWLKKTDAQNKIGFDIAIVYTGFLCSRLAQDLSNMVVVDAERMPLMCQ